MKIITDQRGLGEKIELSILRLVPERDENLRHNTGHNPGNLDPICSEKKRVAQAAVTPPANFVELQTTNLGVGSSNLSGRAINILN
jgi:hypothetical protein